MLGPTAVAAAAAAVAAAAAASSAAGSTVAAASASAVDVSSSWCKRKRCSNSSSTTGDDPVEQLPQPTAAKHGRHATAGSSSSGSGRPAPPEEVAVFVQLAAESPYQSADDSDMYDSVHNIETGEC